MTHKPTIKDVARLAGVSLGTASRVLNGSSATSEASRSAVHNAAHELGYLSNAHARSLRSSHSCLLYTSPSPRDGLLSRMPSSA